jgi:hypothetical protein
MRVEHDHQPSAFAMSASKRILLALACILLGAGPAAAADYYVSPTGGGSACTGSQPCALSYVNPRVAAGDVVRLAAGTYTGTSIAPANSGVSNLPGGMIAYLGSIANPAGTIVPSLALNQNYISIKGVTVTTTATASVHGSDDALEDCVINAPRFEVSGTGGDLNPIVKAARNTFRDISFNLTRLSGTGNATIVFRGMEDSRYDSCRFVINHPATLTGGSFTKLFYSTGNRFVDCGWNMTSLVTASGTDEASWFVIRDNSAHNAFVRDTFTMVTPAGGGSPSVFYAAVTGNSGNEGGVRGLKFDSCIWRASGPFVTGLLVFQDPMDTDTLVHCAIVTPIGNPFYSQHVDHAVINHCTFVTLAANTAAFRVDDNNTWTGTSSITNNIFYSGATTTAAPAVERNGNTNSYVSSDHNLFYSNLGATRSVDYGSGGISVADAYANYGLEHSSVFGNPQFVGGAGVLNYDVHLIAASPARGSASDGSDIGAFSFVAGGGDVTPPAAVTDLVVVQASNDYALLSWTAPGDNGSTGTVAAYDLRYSTQPINAANFATATQVPTAPAILAAGSAQSYGMTGLAASTTYYVALKARDAANNWSAVSNVPMVTTTAVDQLAPARITDFR